MNEICGLETAFDIRCYVGISQISAKWIGLAGDNMKKFFSNEFSIKCWSGIWITKCSYVRPEVETDDNKLLCYENARRMRCSAESGYSAEQEWVTTKSQRFRDVSWCCVVTPKLLGKSFGYKLDVRRCRWVATSVLLRMGHRLWKYYIWQI